MAVECFGRAPLRLFDITLTTSTGSEEDNNELLSSEFSFAIQCQFFQSDLVTQVFKSSSFNSMVWLSDKGKMKQKCQSEIWSQENRQKLERNWPTNKRSTIKKRGNVLREGRDIFCENGCRFALLSENGIGLTTFRTWRCSLSENWILEPAWIFLVVFGLPSASTECIARRIVHCPNLVWKWFPTFAEYKEMCP
jgi:hypothetical protein